jgi:hypothetical protein
LAVRIDGKDFVMQEWMRSGAECGCRTETHLHYFFPAVVHRAAVNERQPSQNSQERCYISLRLGALDEENTSCQ